MSITPLGLITFSSPNFDTAGEEVATFMQAELADELGSDPIQAYMTGSRTTPTVRLYIGGLTDAQADAIVKAVRGQAHDIFQDSKNSPSLPDAHLASDPEAISRDLRNGTQAVNIFATYEPIAPTA